MDPYDKKIYLISSKLYKEKGAVNSRSATPEKDLFFSSGWPLMIELFNGNFIPSVLPQAMYSKEILWPYGLKI